MAKVQLIQQTPKRERHHHRRGRSAGGRSREGLRGLGGNHNMTGIRLTAIHEGNGQQYQQQAESDSEHVYTEVDLPEGRYAVTAISWNKIATAVNCKVYAS